MTSLDAGTGLRTMLARLGYVDPHIERNRRLSVLCHRAWLTYRRR